MFHLRDAAELRSVLERVPIDREQFLLQSFFPGDDHRLLVLNGKLAAAAKRIPASVTGDGRNSIADLVEIENRRRVHSLLYPLKLDAETDRVLAQQGYTSQTVPADGVRIRIRATANMATGGIFVDVTPNVHPDNARLAVRAAKAIGLTVAGIDFISPDISRSWHEVGGGICEVNTGVGVAVKDLFDPAPEEARIVLESAYPRGDDGRIPTAMVTGTYGKTTTCMMLGGILSLMGHTVGTASTEGVTIGD